MTPTSVSWRIPRVIDEGLRIDGEARFAPSGRGDPLTITRTQWVVDDERIETRAGEFRTWRVEYSDDLGLAGQTSVRSGTTWWAPGVGVVRWVEEARGQALVEMELVARGSRGNAEP
ncbi:MAG: hypothetical protein M5U28_44135 [Sandaracinaceae bacterium]|nr:hypothetical protein [Sandaracinaceae bacterium]